MTDYLHGINNGTMMIRDTGSTVEFWFQTGSSTWINGQQWGYQVGSGAFVSGTANIATGGGWTKFGAVSVTSDANVLFRIYDEGLGWPTSDFNVAIDRASAPAAPAKPILTVRSSTVIELDLGADGANNGAAIDSRQYSGSTSSGGWGTNTRAASNNYQWPGLQPGTTYYFWERTHNSKGYSPWSAVASAKTWNVPAAPSTPTISNVTDTTVDVAFTDGANNGQTIDTREIGYGTSSSAPSTSLTSDGSTTITGLTPGTVYYFWARTHNSVGWSAYSARTTATTKRPPDAPSAPVVSEITQTSARAVFTDNGDGGAPITAHQLGWSTDGAGPAAPNVVDSDLDQVLTGLPPGTLVYFFARSQNMYGWGGWSAAQSVRTVAGAWVYDLASKTWKRAVPWVNVNGVWEVGKPWAKIAGVWKGTTS